MAHLTEPDLGEYLELRFDNDEQVIDNSIYKVISHSSDLEKYVSRTLSGMASTDK